MKSRAFLQYPPKLEISFVFSFLMVDIMSTMYAVRILLSCKVSLASSPGRCFSSSRNKSLLVDFFIILSSVNRQGTVVISYSSISSIAVPFARAISTLNCCRADFRFFCLEDIFLFPKLLIWMKDFKFVLWIVSYRRSVSFYAKDDQMPLAQLGMFVH